VHALKAYPDLASAAIIGSLWLEPAWLGIGWFKAGALALMLEFFVIHAGGFMAVTVLDPDASPRKRMLRLAGWSAGYLAFIGLFALGFDAWWMVAAFAWFCFSKLQAIWHDGPPTERDRSHAITSWALSVLVYLLSIAATIDTDLPMLGATPAVRDAAGFTGGGVWEAEPHRALAGAVLYFTVMGLSRPFLAWAFTPRTAPKMDRSPSVK
jgi:hypothetical protein